MYAKNPLFKKTMKINTNQTFQKALNSADLHGILMKGPYNMLSLLLVKNYIILSEKNRGLDRNDQIIYLPITAYLN